MGQNRKYIRNLALSLMGQLKVDQGVFHNWKDFSRQLNPSFELQRSCGTELRAILMRMTPSKVGRIASFGRQGLPPGFKTEGTTLTDVLGEMISTQAANGRYLVVVIAWATIMAEMTDILLERLTPEQRARFEDDGDDGIEPVRGRSIEIGG